MPTPKQRYDQIHTPVKGELDYRSTFTDKTLMVYVNWSNLVDYEPGICLTSLSGRYIKTVRVLLNSIQALRPGRPTQIFYSYLVVDILCCTLSRYKRLDPNLRTVYFSIREFDAGVFSS